MKKTVSLKDIAQKVGVSTALVSYVLNNKEKKARVGKEIAAEIRRVAKEMNYQPNLIARSLKFGKTKTIGLIVADISNPFFSNLARIVENEAKIHGYTVIFGSSDEQLEKFEGLINAFLTRQVDGLIITPVENSQKQIEDLQKKEIPFVLIDRYFPDIQTDTVVINNYDSSYKATKHFIDKGFSNIGMLAYESALEHMKQRISGYVDAYSESVKSKRKKTDKLCLVRYDNINESIEKAVHSLIDVKKVDSILFATISLAVKSLHIINQRKIKVPENLGLISFDESDAFDFFYSPLTFIKQDLQQIGQQSVRLLLDSMSESTRSPVKIQVATELVERESSKKV